MPAGKREDFSVNTIIGPNTSINGNVDSAGFTRVDGSLCGNLSARGRIIIGERARMKSNITGTAVTIGGVVSGSVLASDKVVILATGVVLGDIITQRIQADDGCLIHGRVIVCQTRAKWDSAVSEYRDAEDLKSVTAAFAQRPSVSGKASGAEPAPEDGIRAPADYLTATESVFEAAESSSFHAGYAGAAGSVREAEGRAPESARSEAPQEEALEEKQAAPESAGAEVPRYWDMFKLPALAPPEEQAVVDPALYPEKADSPEDAAIMENAAAGPDEAAIPAEDAAFSGDAAVPAEGAAFSEDAEALPETAAPAEGAVFSENAATGPEEAAIPAEDAAFSGDAAVPAEGAVFSEDAEVLPGTAVFSGDAAASPEGAAPQDGEVPAASPLKEDGAEENHGES
ncbi:MAG: polymer-forming cytoskeletal protein [Treponema sp.]|jgi:cytoskeletal protein CcmA (bactofilin family)|nr:polymer-forming cytoskeletal protein [Treponema sp.]